MLLGFWNSKHVYTPIGVNFLSDLRSLEKAGYIVCEKITQPPLSKELLCAIDGEAMLYFLLRSMG